MRHPWRFYPTFTAWFTAASKRGYESQIQIQIRAFGANIDSQQQ
jgi:hypothetical protein